MSEAVLSMDFPLGKLPVQGYRCPRCGEEIFLGEAVAATQQLAKRLGLYGIEGRGRRTALKIGNSVGLTVDPSTAKALGIEPGTELELGIQGDALVIHVAPSTKKAPRKR